jgi:DNA adenine methylase
MEPFVGGGAVFFHLWRSRRLFKPAFLLDSNEELVNAYKAVQGRTDELVRLLALHQSKHSREYYYEVRCLDRLGAPMSDVERAARTIYLNKTCYNGLYRVNRRGHFNVPMGRYSNPRVLDAENLQAASRALQGVHLEVRSFPCAVDLGQEGDFFYFDPPYDPVSKTASFTSYTAGSFRDEDQRELAGVYAALSRKGCLCMLSNSDTPFVRELYQGFRIEMVRASRAINRHPDGRGPVNELVVLNY